MSLVTASLTGDNYFSWVRSIKFALGAKQKVGFVDGTCQKPTDDVNAIEQWQKSDSMVISWIINSMSKDIAEAFLYATSARDLWVELESRFGESNEPLLYQIQREIASIQQGNVSVAIHYPRAPVQFLMGLNDVYDHVRNQVLLMDPFPTVGKAYSMVQRVEKQRQIHSGITAIDKEGIMNVRTREIKRNPIGRGLPRKGGTMDKRFLHCEHCKKNGHTRDTRFELNGFPEWFKNLTEQKRSNRTPDLKALSIIRTEIRKALQKPDIDLEYSNFVDIEDFADNCVNVFFTYKSCIVQDHQTDKVIARGKQQGKLYVVSGDILQNKNKDSNLANTAGENLDSEKGFVCKDKKIENSNLWHYRLGHAGMDVMKRLHLCNNEQINQLICEICPLAKQHRLPFPHSDSKTKSPFELIHVDVWGPHREYSISHCTFMLTIVDDFTRATWYYMMMHKTQTQQKLEVFYNMVLTQLNKKIKQIRMDNGTEFVNEQCQSFFHNKGIIHQRTCSYTPQQNGKVERKHQHLLQVARSLMFQASMPLKFWTEALLAATYIINWLPTQTLNWKTPYELLYKKVPNYNNIKVFGCMCFASNVTPFKGKFKPRATKCVFLGYTQGQKGYKVMDLENEKVYVTRDAIFHENSFPFANDTKPKLTFPLPNIVEEEENEPNEELANEDINTETQTQTRRTSRVHTKPAWMKDYVCNNSENTEVPTNICMNHEYRCFVESLSCLQEPKNYLEAQKKPEWRHEMEQEISALEKNGTWTFTTLPHGKNTVGCRWIYKTKLKPDGTLERCKARLVAKGYSQIEGEDYSDCFAPVAKAVTVRAFLAIAAGKSWSLHHFDVNNAFLHGRLNEDIYMEAPEGYQIPEGKVCKLNKSLYGLKQASRQWNEEFSHKMTEYGFKQSSHDYCLFTKGEGSKFIALLVYVDDILVTAANDKLITEVKKYLNDLFNIKDLGAARYFLGLEIARSDQGIIVNQNKYTLDIVKDVGLEKGKPTTSPLPAGCKFTLEAGAALDNPSRFRRLIGMLLYLSYTRPEICHATQQLSQFVQHPCQQHWDAAMH
ncbi:UNVERIFIED_CONTAM: Retrovirus-related Pol polyprotein from transposon RE1 [Sesamum indicum]